MAASILLSKCLYKYPITLPGALEKKTQKKVRQGGKRPTAIEATGDRGRARRMYSNCNQFVRVDDDSFRVADGGSYQGSQGGGEAWLCTRMDL